MPPRLVDMIRSPKWQRALQVARPLAMLAGGVLLVWQVCRAWSFLRATTVLLDPRLGGSAFLSAFLAGALQVVIWLVLVQGIGGHPGVAVALEGYVLSFLPRHIPGSVWGYVGRIEWFRRYAALPTATTSMSSLLEILAIGSGTTGFAALLFLEAPIALRWVTLVLLCFASGSIAWLAIRIGGRWWTTIQRRHDSIAERDVGIGPLPWFLAITFVVVNWLIYGWSLLSLAMMLGFRTTRSPADVLLAFATAFSISWLMGFLAPLVPSGIGVREVALSSLLVTVAGMSNSAATSVAVLMRVVTSAAELAWVGYGLGSAALRRRLGNRGRPPPTAGIEEEI